MIELSYVQVAIIFALFVIGQIIVHITYRKAGIEYYNEEYRIGIQEDKEHGVLFYAHNLNGKGVELRGPVSFLVETVVDSLDEQTLEGGSEDEDTSD
jgi:hypothetical protein